MPERPEVLVRSVYAAFGRGDVPGVLAALSEDVTWRCLVPAGVPFGGTFEGRAGVERFFEAVGGAVTFEAFEPGDALASGERVVVLGRDRATVRATGRRYDASWVHAWRVRGERVLEFTEWMEPGPLAEAFAATAAARPTGGSCVPAPYDGSEFSVRRLGPADAAAARALRLRALREHPEAYLVDLTEEERDDAAAWAARLRAKEGRDDDGLLGAFEGDRLVGMTGFVREGNLKTRHKAVIWGVYVVPEARGRGAGRALLVAALDGLRACGDVEIATLSVSARTAAARALYVSLGFVPWGVEPGAMRVGGALVDEEFMSLRLRPDRAD
jgi:ketosteroid isomerase-like protein/ribosomal protein S18 acetylase RimI-like enzyme